MKPVYCYHCLFFSPYHLVISPLHYSLPLFSFLFTLSSLAFSSCSQRCVISSEKCADKQGTDCAEGLNCSAATGWLFCSCNTATIVLDGSPSNQRFQTKDAKSRSEAATFWCAITEQYVILSNLHFIISSHRAISGATQELIDFLTASERREGGEMIWCLHVSACRKTHHAPAGSLWLTLWELRIYSHCYLPILQEVHS